ncbi:hypothetical protein ABFB09_07325 [Dehalogenimonas sp. THU2]|uniref:hypothetical protein n=1 Tax=Dehalogenimonas sp. THU2 TaxID=3151121 RepID=UPI00321863E5
MIEIRSIIPMVFNQNGIGHRSTLLEIMVNGHLMKLTSEEACRLEIEPLTPVAGSVRVMEAACR